MFKSWRSDKKKIKVVFQLQFQATQVPKLKKSGVTIALVPEDLGKPTLRLEKVAAQDGSCLWENPVYETVKMIREMKTGKLSEKIYHFVFSNGSSKAGFLGEASIDFADFAAETEPVTVSLPLKFANSGAILHVTIHKIEGAEDQRYTQDGGDLTISREGSLHSQGMNYSDNLQNSTEDGDLDTAELFSSLRKNSMPQRAADTGINKKNMHQRTNTDWSGSSTSDGSLAELANSPEDITREWHKGSGDPVEKLRSENAMLTRQVEVSELEVQSLKKQILKENNRTQDLSRQISSLKEERDAVKMEFERLKSKKNMDEEESDSGSEDENEGSKVLLKEIRQELEHEKELNANLRLQLQKTEDSNSNLILAVRDLNEMLEQKNREIASLSSEIEASTSVEEARSNEQHDADEMHMLKQTITDLNAELELKQNQQSEYLATINELESQVQRLEDKIKQQSEDYSESLIAINELESQVKELSKELENRTQGFEKELDAMIHSKNEQEQRAIRAEEALKTTRWKNAANAEQLQEEFKKLSVEMAGRFDENEKTTMKAVAEANDLEVLKINLEEMLQEANEELRLLKDQTVTEREDLTYQLDLKEKQIAEMSRELDDKTALLEYAQKQEKERQEAFSKEIQILKTEIEKLEEQRSQFSDHAKRCDETQKVKKSNEKTEILIQRWNKERDELEKKIASAKKETERAQKQIISTRSLKDKKEMVSNLQSEMENIRGECNDLKHRLLREEREKEKLRKQVSQLKNDVQKKEEEVSSIQKELKSTGGQVDITARSGYSAVAPQESKDITSLQKKMRLLKEQINLMEAALKSSTNSDPVKGSNLSNMMEELEIIMEQLKICHCSSADQCQKEQGKFRDKLHSKMTNAEGKRSSTIVVPVESDVNIAELLSEMEGLKERNKSMERELKDMEERYSEISLKFAEVEGERQQLVMTVRNLKNGKKN
ncbi:golgin subfamily B member 1-like isoform X4 [Hibiscus syriacus]|uniref:golgin subfamily B member 1-like isoform X4 n=1 Tax=Hibiscus syriacus TaxID=106335 RepID=UPI0019211340|nr:golgin subfamily B member 1-like isoform X4 [Hibiscus syriacus]